jgi:RND family efflux transporter MFP subunit
MSFTHVVAPFDGVVTKRNVNVGDLIDANSTKPLFVLTQSSALRAYVYVPQAYSKGVQVGQKVNIVQAEQAGQTFKGTVTRTAKAIDPGSRSLQVEVGIDNSGGQLLPGAYVQVEMPLAQHNGLTIPVNALLLRGEGPRVALVAQDGKVKLLPVVLGKDFGMKIEVLSGITAEDRVVLNPPDGLEEGDTLSVVEKPATKAK